MARFSDKVIIITGAASGIGEATARRLAEEGARLVLCDLDGDNLDRVAASLDPAEVAIRVTDVSDFAACEALVVERDPTVVLPAAI